jgi:hypothetical protein
MRRFLLSLSLVVTLGALASTASASSFVASFEVYFGGKAQNAHPCGGGAFVCGAGTVAGRGAATTMLFITGFTHDWDASGCLGITAEEVVTLVDGTGTLTLSASGNICAPSPAAGFPSESGALHTYGAPYRAQLAYTVIDATGVFAGSLGTGIVSLRTAGEAGSVAISGTV